MAKLKHGNIIGFYGGIFETNKYPQIVMELMDRNLYDILTKVKLNLFERIELAKEACKGLAYLEQQKIFHGDYKPENVLYDIVSKIVKITDFGFSEQMHKKDNGMEICRGTPYYLAPEVFVEKRFGSYSDVYSFGISLAVHIKRNAPYEVNFETNHLLNCIAAYNMRPDLPMSETECPTSLKNLAYKCWNPVSFYRPTFAEILRELDFVLVDCLFVNNFYAKNFWRSFYRFGYLYDVPDHLFVDALISANFDSNRVEEAKRIFVVNGSVNIHHFEKFIGLFF